MDLTCKFAVLTNKKSLDSAVTSDWAISAQTLVHNGTVKEYKVLWKKEVEIHSSKVNVTASDTTLLDTLTLTITATFVTPLRILYQIPVKTS